VRLAHLSVEAASNAATETLGLGATTVNLISPEGLCASLRRAASFLCPTSPREIVDAVLDAVAPLSSVGEPSRDDLMEYLDKLISLGDLLELQDQPQGSTRQIFLAPPSFVVKDPGRYLVLGTRPFAAPLIGGHLADEMVYERQMRSVNLPIDTAKAQLVAAGLREISRDQWMRHPRSCPASELLEEYSMRLASARPSGEIDGMTVIDPNSSVQYYRGRWREPKPSDTGLFVARRPQAYKADLWCMVRTSQGIPQTFIDLPVLDADGSGHDEGWRAQAAIDAEQGHPQVLRIRAGSGGTTVLDGFSPVPSWAHRYLELVGSSTPHGKGALFSYEVADTVVPEVSAFLIKMLWMRVL
jgi:hypothetical protein